MICLRLVVLVLAVSLAGPAAAADLWRQDLAAARAEARRSGQPLFLYFDAAWCSWCHRYERQTLSDPQVRGMLAQRTIPVRIDWDARPDLVHRYGGRGLPFNVLLAPDGRVLRRFTGILTPADLIALLRQPATGAGEPTESRAIRPQGLDREAYRAFRDAFLEHLERLYDPGVGTLAGRFATGAGLKRPQPRTWLWLEARALWPEQRRRAARTEADRLLDPLDGGFFYYVDPHRPDSHLETAKLLEPNAWLTAWLGGVPGRPGLAAQSGWYFLRDMLWDEARGGFWRAQVADADYYGRAADDRLTGEPPPVQRVKLAGANAEAVRALVRAAERLDRPQLTAYAERTMTFLLGDLWRDGRLHRVYRDGRAAVPALPADRLRVLAAAGELAAVGRDARRETRLQALAERTAGWIRTRMQQPDPALRPELAGLTALICGQRRRYPQLPAGCQRWALGQLALGPETRPDSMIPGLRAWHRRLQAGRNTMP